MCIRDGKTITLLFSLKAFEILHKKRRGQVSSVLMEYFNSNVESLVRPFEAAYCMLFILHEYLYYLCDLTICYRRLWSIKIRKQEVLLLHKVVSIGERWKYVFEKLMLSQFAIATRLWHCLATWWLPTFPFLSWRTPVEGAVG